jgi:hypothetical protein
MSQVRLQTSGERSDQKRLTLGASPEEGEFVFVVVEVDDEAAFD